MPALLPCLLPSAAAAAGRQCVTQRRPAAVACCRPPAPPPLAQRALVPSGRQCGSTSRNLTQHAAPTRTRRRSSVVCAAGCQCQLAPGPQCQAKGVLDQTKDVFTVGSGAGADVVVSAPGVAAEHCRFNWRGGRLFVTDLGAGTTFDGNPLMAEVAYLVGNGAKICLGGTPAAEFIVTMGQVATNPMEAMLADAFKQKFAGSTNSEVQAALKDLNG